MITCPKCGAELSDTARFCRKCGEKIEVAADPEFEEPKEAEDGTVDFDWDQPVEIEESEAELPEEAVEPEKQEGEAEPENQEEGEETFGDGSDSGSARKHDRATDIREWGPPTGGGSHEDDTMMPVTFAGRESAIEEIDREDYGYTAEGVIPPWDHTHEFDLQDISDNKVIAMAAYLLGPLGIIIALLAAQSSPYVGFHVRQAMKFIVLEALTTIVMALLCWTLIVPAAGAVFLIILMVLQIIAFVSVCKGRAVEPPILRSLRFLK